MSTIRRFMALDDENSVFKITVDTTKIKVGATDGSQLDDRFQLPILHTFPFSFILYVSDGRAEVSVNASNYTTYRTIIFATPGIYTIILIGRATIRFVSWSVDLLKVTELLQMDAGFKLTDQSFMNCSNLVVKAPYINMNTLDRVFNGINRIEADISKYTVHQATRGYFTFLNIANPVTKIFSGFFDSLTNANEFYKNTDFSNISECVIIAPNLLSAVETFSTTNFRGRIVIQSNTLTDIRWFIRYVSNPPSLGEVDIRNVTRADFFISSLMSTANVDATLKGWVNNFDWSGIAPVANKVTFDFYNSKYSNNPDVIAAKTFLEAKGIVFTRLTMA